MNKLYLILILMVSIPCNASADNYGNVLADGRVNHFQLLANNLQMIYIMAKMLEDKVGEAEDKTDDFEEIYAKFYSTEDERLLLIIVMKAPFTKVTTENCNQQLDKEYDSIKDRLGSLLVLASHFPLNKGQAQSIVNNALMNLTLKAKENDEFSITCEK